MIICRVVGNIWSTKKDEALKGLKLMIVQEISHDGVEGNTYVAADKVDAGEGEKVLVVSGSAARRALGDDTIPIDSAIVGIIDEEVDKAMQKKYINKKTNK